MSAQRDHGDTHVGRALCRVDPPSAPRPMLLALRSEGGPRTQFRRARRPVHPLLIAGWLAATGTFPEHRGAACSAYLAGRTWPGMCWLSPLPWCPQVPRGCWWEEPELRRLPPIARRTNDSAEAGDSVESPQEAHAVTQCVSRASRAGSVRALRPCTLWELGVWGPWVLGRWNLQGWTGGQAGQGSTSSGPHNWLAHQPPAHKQGFPGESALGRRPTLGPQY